MSLFASVVALAATAPMRVAAQPPVAVAAASPLSSSADPDPWERVNRHLYRFDRALDRHLLRPGVVFYHHATPRSVRQVIGNALSNMTDPVILFNDVLQLRPTAAGRTLARLAINSTVGVAGLFDVAADAGVAHHDADFGQTLGRYGVAAGPYVYLPVLGPTTVRDAFGRGVDTIADPLNTVRYDGRDALTATRTVLGALQARDAVDPLLKTIDATATDPYVTVRSLYLQNRAALVAGSPTSLRSVEAMPDFGSEPGDAPAVPAAPAGARPSTPPAPVAGDPRGL